MLAVLLDGKGSVKLVEMERPQPAKDEILVKMQACGLCGTDVEKIKGEYTASRPIIGHEPAGIISEVGDEVKDFKVGDRVFVHHHVSCGECWYCTHGSETMCSTYRSTNILPGGFSEYFLVPALNIKRGGVLKLPPDVSFDEGALIEPLACCIRALARADADDADRILVLGCGPMGLMHIKLLANRNKEVVAADINPIRLEVARRLGATHTMLSNDKNFKEDLYKVTSGIMPDISIVASGNLSAISTAIECTRKGGKILIFGVPAKHSMQEIDMSSFFNSEHSILTSYGATERETRIALDILSVHAKEFNAIISHHFNLKEFEDALKLYYSGNCIKIVITA